MTAVATEPAKNDLFKNHDIAYLSPQIQSPQEAEVFLLCETHLCDSDLIANAELIDKLMTEGSILFLEAIKSMDPIQNDPIIYNQHRLSERAQGSLSFFGWDHYSYRAKDASSSENIHRPLDRRIGTNWMNGADWTEFREIEENSARDFPQRTAAMISTLTKIEQLRKTNKITGPIFFIAGGDHLITKNQDLRYSLQELYATLSTMRAVILNPKPKH